MSRTPKGIKRPIEKSTGATRSLARIAIAATKTTMATLKGLVKARHHCQNCGGPLVYRPNEVGGTVRRWCSKACKLARHNDKRHPEYAEIVAQIAAKEKAS